MLKRILATIAVAATLSAPASGATITYFTDGVQDDIPGLTGFMTTGDLMAGMTVTACFTAGCGPALVWAATGVGSGGVTAGQWSLSVTGDTFNADAWSFVFNANQTLGQLVSLTLDGAAFTLFDRTDPSPGTDGSAQGRDFNTGIDGFIDVTYHDPVAVIPDGPVGDLYHSMTLSSRRAAARGRASSFAGHADNDSRLTAPEPTTLALLGIASLGLALVAPPPYLIVALQRDKAPWGALSLENQRGKQGRKSECSCVSRLRQLSGLWTCGTGRFPSVQNSTPCRLCEGILNLDAPSSLFCSGGEHCASFLSVDFTDLTEPLGNRLLRTTKRFPFR
jgi:hypothetical protein